MFCVCVCVCMFVRVAKYNMCLMDCCRLMLACMYIHIYVYDC